MDTKTLVQADEDIARRYEDQRLIVLDITLRKCLGEADLAMRNLLSLQPNCALAVREEAEIEVMVRLRSVVQHFQGLYMFHKPDWSVHDFVHRKLQIAIDAVRHDTLEHPHIVRYLGIVNGMGYG